MDTTDTTTTVDPIAALKAVQASRIRDGFDMAPLNGLMTTSGIQVDAQRDDIDNLTRLRDRLLQTGTTSTTTTIRDYTNQFHTVTIAQLTEIIGELVDFGLGLYSHKWSLEQTLAAATTSDEVQAVVW